MLLQTIAQSITRNNPERHLIVLLIDERPEEVTEMVRTVRGEVVASTFDEPPQRHVKVAETVIEKVKRLVEHKQDVVILLDSITRLARAYNTVIPSSGKVLTGGLDANALECPKRFFVLLVTLKKVVACLLLPVPLLILVVKWIALFLKSLRGKTGNQEITLERDLAEKRVFPAINIKKVWHTPRRAFIGRRQAAQDMDFTQITSTNGWRASH